MTGERKKRPWGQGRVFRRGGRWHISYCVNGKEHREPGGETEREARRLLRQRMKQIHAGSYVGPKRERLTVDEMLDSLEIHLTNKGAKAMVSLKSHLKPVREAFGTERATTLTPERIEEFVANRLAVGKAAATVNREVGALKQAFNLALRQKRVREVPYVPMLKEDNKREGFFEKPEFEAVVANLPAYLVDVARYGFLTGWRKSEILSLKWDAVDRQAPEVRLRTSKNGRGRVLPLTGHLMDLIECRWSARKVKLANGETYLSDLVFHRSGKPIGDFRKAWQTACIKAGVPGKLFHDLRRSSIRIMVRAGTPERVAMEISGHRTRSVFDRYNIVSDEDMRDALRRSQEHLAKQPSRPTNFAFPEEGRFDEHSDKIRTKCTTVQQKKEVS